jgi:hypothetical protein
MLVSHLAAALDRRRPLFGIGVRYLTGGSDVGYILPAGRADVKRLRKARLGRG